MKRNLLITGVPGIGKTTLIRKLADRLQAHAPAGFYTGEIREEGIRKGFELASLSGTTSVLSHVDIKGQYRVGRYGVDLRRFERFLKEAQLLHVDTQLLIIDEIGKMECLSQKFVRLLQEALDSDTAVLATIARRGSGVIADVKRRRDVVLIEVTRSNRNALPERIAAMVEEVLAP